MAIASKVTKQSLIELLPIRRRVEIADDEVVGNVRATDTFSARRFSGSYAAPPFCRHFHAEEGIYSASIATVSQGGQRPVCPAPPGHCQRKRGPNESRAGAGERGCQAD